METSHLGALAPKTFILCILSSYGSLGSFPSTARGSVSGDGCAGHRSMGIVTSHELLNPHVTLESPHTLMMTAISKSKLGIQATCQPDSHLIQIMGLLISLLHSCPPEEIKLLSGTRNPFLKFSHRGRKLIRSVG